MPKLIDSIHQAAGGYLEWQRERQRRDEAMQWQLGQHPMQLKQRQSYADAWAQANATRERDPDELNYELEGIRAGWISPEQIVRFDLEDREYQQRQQMILDRMSTLEQQRHEQRLVEDKQKTEQDIKKQRETEIIRQDLKSQYEAGKTQRNINWMRRIPGLEGDARWTEVEAMLRGGASPIQVAGMLLRQQTEARLAKTPRAKPGINRDRLGKIGAARTQQVDAKMEIIKAQIEQVQKHLDELDDERLVPGHEKELRRLKTLQNQLLQERLDIANRAEAIVTLAPDVAGESLTEEAFQGIVQYIEQSMPGSSPQEKEEAAVQLAEELGWEL